MKRVILGLLIFILYFYGSVFADDEDERIIDNSKLWDEIEEVSINPSKSPVLNSRAAVVIDRNSKAVIFGKNENEKRAMASTTKIMTAILVLEMGDLSRNSRSITKSCWNWRVKIRLKNRRQNYNKRFALWLNALFSEMMRLFKLHKQLEEV